MAKCPKCGKSVSNPTKQWKYAAYQVKMYECSCGKRFREYWMQNTLKFVL